MTDFYVDRVLGDWKLQKKTKESLIYGRGAEIKVPSHDPMVYFENNKEYRIHGRLRIRQEKKINVQTSLESLFRYVDLLDETVKFEVR